MKKITPKNYRWYLLQMKDGYSPSGHAIAQYVDGHYFEEQSENTLLDLEINKTIKELKEDEHI